MPFSSRKILKRKKEVLHVHLDFKNGLISDILVDSGVYVSAVLQEKLDKIKQQAPTSIFKTDKPPSFWNQVANGQVRKPFAINTLKFDIGTMLLQNALS